MLCGANKVFENMRCAKRKQTLGLGQQLNPSAGG